ncbi:hypothetical protein H696_02970 [Fonticula alba]|uniref:Alpha N-terminal protein methyltransferase 1 n=1 Tax=Fonticula alba TaxID=691883 RepID=A0A058Z9L8_FONAL|nr:hypothetical protein H696_02970 [Fonticula alba]KCV70613.1 hypothetical protein H696_02970 [Fonticula alba]|eukprot:XP_009495129.1 hypothetical protein H696_02970 [Fonticula alba]
MEAFEPVAGREYSAIWMQWVIGYLTDEDMVRFLLTCRRILTRDGPGGMVFLKDNVGTQEHIYDESDASITRTDAHIRRLFQKAGYILVDVKPQTRFPKYMIPVNMYAYKPDPLFTEEEPTTKAPGKE